MYHTPPPLSCNGQFNVLLFFLGEKDDFTMTKAVRGGGGLKESFSFFYKFFLIFGRLKLSFSFE